MIWQLPMQYTLGILHFGEQLFTTVCSAKHTHYLLGVSDKTGESSRKKHGIFIEIEDVASKKLTSNLLNTDGQWVLSTDVMSLYS